MFIVPEDPVDTLVKVSGCDDDFDLDVWSPSIAIMKEAGIINEIENRPLFTQLKKDQNGIDKIATRLAEPSFQIKRYFVARTIRLLGSLAFLSEISPLANLPKGFSSAIAQEVAQKLLLGLWVLKHMHLHD